MAKSAGLQPLIIESDSFSVIKMINGEGEISWIIEELRNLTFPWKKDPSQYNVAAAHFLAKLALSTEKRML